MLLVSWSNSGDRMTASPASIFWIVLFNFPGRVRSNFKNVSNFPTHSLGKFIVSSNIIFLQMEPNDPKR